jgi:hypothetical protein
MLDCLQGLYLDFGQVAVYRVFTLIMDTEVAVDRVFTLDTLKWTVIGSLPGSLARYRVFTLILDCLQGLYLDSRHVVVYRVFTLIMDTEVAVDRVFTLNTLV